MAEVIEKERKKERECNIPKSIPKYLILAVIDT